jgi:hypothetical protein
MGDLFQWLYLGKSKGTKTERERKRGNGKCHVHFMVKIILFICIGGILLTA